MFSKIKIKKSKLDYFRRMARKHYPLEIEAYLLGHVKSVNEILITDVVYPKTYKKQTKVEVCWNANEYCELKKRAQESEKRIVGDIHSHPKYDAILSETDYEGMLTEVMLVGGICSVIKGKTKVLFWTPSSALPCEIVYI